MYMYTQFLGLAKVLHVDYQFGEIGCAIQIFRASKGHMTTVVVRH